MHAAQVMGLAHDGAMKCLGCAQDAGWPMNEEEQIEGEYNPIFGQDVQDDDACEDCHELLIDQL